MAAASLQDVHLLANCAFGPAHLLWEPLPPHAKLPVTKKHFERWLGLFHTTIDELFEGEKAGEAKWRASKMAEMFQIKIDYYGKDNLKPLI